MIKHFVTAIGDIATYGIVSICLFVAVFTGAILWALFQKKAFLQTMSTLPLNDGEKTPTGKAASHE